MKVKISIIALVSSLAYLAPSPAVLAEDSIKINTKPEIPMDTATHHAAKDKEGAYFTHAISFEKGSSQLKADASKSLDQLVRGLKANGKLGDVKIVAWSDNSLPLDRDVSLSKADKKLASERAKNINNFLSKNLDLRNAEQFNMAEHENWLARTFNTDDADLKSRFSREATAPMSEEAFMKVKEHGGPSTALVIIQQKQRY